jgi:hypothetical protein
MILPLGTIFISEINIGISVLGNHLPQEVHFSKRFDEMGKLKIMIREVS